MVLTFDGDRVLEAKERGQCGLTPDARPGSGSAGRPPEQLLDTAALPFGRTACAAIANRHRGSFLAWRRGRTVVDVALGGNRCPDTLGNDPHDDHDAFVSLLAQPHLVTGPDRMRRAVSSGRSNSGRGNLGFLKH